MSTPLPFYTVGDMVFVQRDVLEREGVAGARRAPECVLAYVSAISFLDAAGWWEYSCVFLSPTRDDPDEPVFSSYWLRSADIYAAPVGELSRADRLRIEAVLDTSPNSELPRPVIDRVLGIFNGTEPRRSTPEPETQQQYRGGYPEQPTPQVQPVRGDIIV